MRVTYLSLTDFRNYRTAEVPFAAGANLFVGRNGQGKTNLVESLGYLSALGSHRVSSEQAMIRQGAKSAIVRVRIQHDGRELLVEVQLNRGAANRAQANRAAIKPRELPRYFSSVLFAPEDLALVRGEPGVRRRFLDQLLIQRNPRLSAVIAEYERVLKQRNTLLKSARASRVREDQLGTLDIWDDRLLTLGAELITARLDLVARLSDPLVAAYRSVAGDDHHPRLLPQLTIRGARVEDEEDDDSVADITSVAGDTTEVFRQALAGVRRKELERGLTLVGPHRDDVLFELNGLPAKGYASHGESWSFALALKLASAELLRRESVTGDPVLILDDVFAELDRARRRMLATAVAGYEQVLITAAVYEDVPAELAAHTVRIEAGAIVEPS
ncbi:recombination protein F [Leifsonia xyli subsp. cynodontis DSM 46306]|uniref:DNA replication and repair protein RecF n=1 Tax=Leifsonia xyli subsp. cynodontis DSM 46306 TaxID=1389489 RepID=U3PA15_LEIXC|nr:DNA replication/repair protein RecF [Leifsonia xyli]AGW40288.1 recombination protein F [Leifsonia xyli subsp. cynodontis DSM 46306]